MKKFAFILTLTAALFLFSFGKSITHHKQTINPLLGDISFISKFGYEPSVTTDEDLRIKTHLEYVEQLLREKNCSHLSQQQKAKREKLLDLLHEYWTAGIFPRNYDHAGRVPCFIDKDGRICAVGYLVEQTAGRETAEKINATHKYEKLLAMNDRTVDSWVINSGLTAEECAMIQPSYGLQPPTYIYNNYNYISPKYGISSAVLGGVNMSVTALNAIQMVKGTQGKALPIIGLVTGASSVVYGAINFPKQRYMGPNYGTNETQKALSIFNIGLGTATMCFSAWNLATRPKKLYNVTWNIYSFPTAEKQTGMGFSLTKRF